MTYVEMKTRLLKIAIRCAECGPGSAQQSVVFCELRQGLAIEKAQVDVAFERVVLTCWHDLFRDGELAWGTDFDNPGPPFYHIPNRKYRSS